MFLHSPLRRSGLFVPAVTCIGILCLFLQSTSLPSTFSSSSSVQFYKNDTASINNLVTEVDVRHNHQRDQSGTQPREDKFIQTSEKQKPFFFWHIGAHKTGSSSFQRFINEERENLKVDNYLVGHRCGTRYPCNGAGQLLQILLGEPSFLDCLTVWERHVHTAVNTTTTSTSLPSYEGEKIPTFHVNEDEYFSLEPIPCWRELFTRKLDRISSNNIIMMREAFSYALWMHLKPWGFKLVALELQRRWNTTIVVTHRRFAEWLVSCIYFRKAEHYHSQIQWKQKGMNFLIKNLYPFNFVEKTISDPFFSQKGGNQRDEEYTPLLGRSSTNAAFSVSRRVVTVLARCWFQRIRCGYGCPSKPGSRISLQCLAGVGSPCLSRILQRRVPTLER